jgi:hypothetical protein
LRKFQKKIPVSSRALGLPAGLAADAEAMVTYLHG